MSGGAIKGPERAHLQRSDVRIFVKMQHEFVGPVFIEGSAGGGAGIAIDRTTLRDPAAMEAARQTVEDMVWDMLYGHLADAVDALINARKNPSRFGHPQMDADLVQNHTDTRLAAIAKLIKEGWTAPRLPDGETQNGRVPFSGEITKE